MEWEVFLLLYSLWLSISDIYISVNAIDLQLSKMKKTPFSQFLFLTTVTASCIQPDSKPRIRSDFVIVEFIISMTANHFLRQR